MELESVLTLFLTPLAGTLVALTFGRFGLTGQLRKIELIEKKADLLEKVKRSSSISGELTARLGEELEEDLRDIISAPVNFETEFGSMKDKGTEVSVEPQRVRKPNKNFEELPWFRRHIFLPVPKTFLGWVFIACYYYFIFGAVVGASLLLTESLNKGLASMYDFFIFLLSSLIMISIVYFPFRALIVFQYRRYVRNEAYRSTIKTKYASI